MTERKNARVRFEVFRRSDGPLISQTNPTPSAQFNGDESRWELDLSIDDLVRIAAQEGFSVKITAFENSDDLSVLEILDGPSDEDD